MNKKNKLIHVDPGFHKKLKIESSIREMSILEYTRFLANSDDDDKPKRRFKLDF